MMSCSLALLRGRTGRTTIPKGVPGGDVALRDTGSGDGWVVLGDLVVFSDLNDSMVL